MESTFIVYTINFHAINAFAINCCLPLFSPHGPGHLGGPESLGDAEDGLPGPLQGPLGPRLAWVGLQTALDNLRNGREGSEVEERKGKERKRK